MLDIAAELQLLNVKGASDGTDGKLKVCCPFHDDSNPSCSIDIKSGRFNCYSCNTTGDTILLLSRFRNEKPVATRKYVQQKYGVNLEKTIAASLIESCHQTIWTEPKLLEALASRAVTPDLITQFRLGSQDGRISIPITNAAGFYVDLRLYSPGAESHKFVSMKGYGGNNLYPINQTSYDKLLLVGGEIKAIACAGAMNQHGYGVVSGTTGEGKFETAWLEYFRDKELYVIMDVDAAGIKAAKKLCHFISSVTKAIYLVTLPLDLKKFPKGGPDDFLASGGDLLRVLQDTEEWQPDVQLVNTEPKKVTLAKVFSAKESGNRLQFKGVIDCLSENTYHIPKTVSIVCDKGQPDCTMCPLVHPSKTNNFVMLPESTFILEAAACSKVAISYAVRDTLRIPQTCRAWTYEVIDRYAVEDVRLSSELDVAHREIEREMQPAYIVKDEADQDVLSNETYEFTGRTWPSPKNQQAISVISDYKLIESALESYVCTDPEKLQVFQPVEWTVESLRSKLDHIYSDLEANVTRIFERREIHLATDLAYHSPLFFTFDKKLQNGWVSCLILGDSSQGKSEAIKNLSEHYKLGQIIESGGVTPAGLLGGIDKINGAFFVSWGAMAQQDKRLLIIEELSENKNEELLGRMNDTRSRGVIQLNKIKKGIARARTRTIFASNPPGRRSMSSYNYGVDAITDLIGHPQYIRRFDFAVIVQQSEVDGEFLQTYRPEHPHLYTSELCNELVLWAWTVKHVTFEDENCVLDYAVKLTKAYSEDIPLIDKGSMRIKLARLAAAVAARTYSIDPERPDTCLVRNCHVQFIYAFLHAMYSKPTFGYLDYSVVQQELNTLKDVDIVLKKINSLSYPRDFVEGAVRSNNIDLQQILDTSGLERSEAQSLLSFLVRYRALRRAGRSYYKTEAFCTCLKQWAGSNGTLKEKPEFIKEGHFGDTL